VLIWYKILGIFGVEGGGGGPISVNTPATRTIVFPPEAARTIVLS
jgi:hypothetical protein